MITVVRQLKCKTLDEKWGNVKTEPGLPVDDGTQMNYRCPRRYAKQDPAAKAVCKDTKVIVSGDVQKPPCFKLGNRVSEILHGLREMYELCLPNNRVRLKQSSCVSKTLILNYALIYLGI